MQAITHQREEESPWVTVISASVDIASQEPVVTDSTLKRLTPGEIKRAQKEDLLSQTSCHSNKEDIP